MNIDMTVKFSTRKLKSWLNRVSMFSRYISAVGILPTDGKKKVYNKYVKSSQKKVKISGKNHRMTLAKLAYQNEFGANILIKHRYQTVVSKTKNVFKEKGLRVRITTNTISRSSELRNAREQGYLLTDKNGKGLAYFAPGKTIRIPERPFLRPVIKHLRPKTVNNANDILVKTLINKTIAPKDAFTRITKLVQKEIKHNIMYNSKANHPLTVQAKGKDTPLRDTNNSLYKNIKFKVYSNPYKLGITSNQEYHKLFVKHSEELLKTAEQFNEITPEITNTTSLYYYKTKD